VSFPVMATEPRDVAASTAKGALRGAFVCAIPAIMGAYTAGAIGLRIGGAITFACLPFGVTFGAFAGLANSAK